MLVDLREKDGLSFWLSIMLGWGVTVASGVVTYPLDTVRRRMMMTSMVKAEDLKYTGARDCFRQILKNEGFQSLMKGAGANNLRGVAGAGVLVGFDTFKAVYLQWRRKVYATCHK